MVGGEGLVFGAKSVGGRAASLVGDAGVEAFNEPNGGSPTKGAETWRASSGSRSCSRKRDPDPAFGPM
jgi:hypothetical protein